MRQEGGAARTGRPRPEEAGRGAGCGPGGPPHLFFVSMLFAALTAIAAPTCDVTSYGAKNDGTSRSTGAIREAIQACSKAGGGTVYFPAGVYQTGAIELASNIVLNIDAGATLRFLTDLAEYPLVPGRSEGTEGLTPAPLIGGRNLQNIAITGRGTLTTDNAAWVKQMNNAEARAMWQSIQTRLENREPVLEADYRKAAPSLRPSFIRPMDSKNILIEGIHIVGSSMWAIHLLYCENVVVRNVIVETYPGANPDGIDIDSSREVRVSDSYFDTGDDGIVLKSGKGVDGAKSGPPYGKHYDHELYFWEGARRGGDRQRDRGRRAQRGGQ